jgi:hypothetical protein
MSNKEPKQEMKKQETEASTRLPHFSPQNCFPIFVTR